MGKAQGRSLRQDSNCGFSFGVDDAVPGQALVLIYFQMHNNEKPPHWACSGFFGERAISLKRVMDLNSITILARLGPADAQ